MRRSHKALARVLAVLALAGAVVALAAVVAGSFDDDGSDSQRGRIGNDAQRGDGKKADKDKPRKSYVVQPGDTLSSIAEKTGLSISRLEQLNPDVDPQILIAGEKLKLR